MNSKPDDILTPALLGPAYEPQEEQELLEYLTNLYRNVFTQEAIYAHLVNHVGYPVAEYGLGIIRPLVSPKARILDVGAGFGSFVVCARHAGFDAIGVEVAPFEVSFARRRLARLRPQDNPQAVFHLDDAIKVELSSSSLDAITLWNLLEHVEDVGALIGFAARALKPGGYAFIVCPNYAARRQEAHYHIPWKPKLRLDR